MKNFWKITLIPGLCCIFAGVVLAAILVLGFADELIEYRDEFSINEDNFFEYFDGDKFVSITREGTRYDKSDTKESYHFAVSDGENISSLDFEFAVGEVEIRTGDTMEVTVVDMFENAITSEVKNGVWYIKDSLIDSGRVHSEYSPEIMITIPADMEFEQVEMYLAAGMLDAKELSARKVNLEVDAGSMKVFKLTAEDALGLKNGVGEIKVYDAKISNLAVDNGIGAISITGAVSGHNTVTCGIGEVKLSLTDRDSVDFNYSVDCGIGEVEIGGRSFSGNAESNSFDRSGADFFALDCGIGHIEINLNGN